MKSVHVSFSEEEYEILRKAAYDLKISTAAFVRSAANVMAKYEGPQSPEETLHRLIGNPKPGEKLEAIPKKKRK